MSDWSADDLARAIERRRGKRRRERSEAERAEAEIRDWSETDWAAAVERRHGYTAEPIGTVAVDDREVHVMHLIGQAYPWRAYAWTETDRAGEPKFASAVHDPSTMKTPRDALKAARR